MTPAVSLDRHLSGPRKWEPGVWDSGRDGLEEKVQGEAGRRPGDACRGPREQREDAKGGKGPEEVGRKGKRRPERPAQGTAHCRHLPSGHGKLCPAFSSASISVPGCPGFSPPVAPPHCSPAALLHLGQHGLLTGRESRCRHCVERRLRKSLTHALPSSPTLVRTDHISADSRLDLCFPHAVISRLIQQKRQCY